MFDNEFETCMEMTDAQIETDFERFSKLTQGNGQIRLGVGVHNAIKGFVCWAWHVQRLGYDPYTTRFNPINQSQWIRTGNTHNMFVRDGEVNAKATAPV